MVRLVSSLVCPPPTGHGVSGVAFLEPPYLERCHQLLRPNPAATLLCCVTRVYTLLSIFELGSSYETGIDVFGETVGSSEESTCVQSSQPRQCNRDKVAYQVK